MDRKFDYVADTKNGTDLGGWTKEQILQAGWYALQSRKEQNDKMTKVRTLLKSDPRMQDLVSKAKEQIKKKA